MSVAADERVVERTALDRFEELGWEVLYGPDVAPGEPEAERSDYTEVVLRGRLERSVELLNADVPEARDEAVRRVLHPESPSLVENNWRFHRMLTDGVDVEVRRDDGTLSASR